MQRRSHSTGIGSASLRRLHTGDWTTPGDAHIAVLDLATLAPRFVRAIKVTDATAAVRTKLGL